MSPPVSASPRTPTTDEPVPPRGWRQWVPWTGRATRADKALMAVLTAVATFELALRPIGPFLLATHPSLLALLTGDQTAIGAAAAFVRVGEGQLWVVLLAGAAGMAKLDWLMWWAGRRWGSRMVDMVTFGRRGRHFARRATALDPRVLRVAVVLAAFPGFPTALVYAVAGWAGMRLRTFVVLDLLGTSLVTTLVAGLGYELGRQAVDLVLLVDEYASLAGLAVLAALAVPPLLGRLKRRGAAPRA